MREGKQGDKEKVHEKSLMEEEEEAGRKRRVKGCWPRMEDESEKP